MSELDKFIKRSNIPSHEYENTGKTTKNATKYYSFSGGSFTKKQADKELVKTFGKDHKYVSKSKALSKLKK